MEVIRQVSQEIVFSAVLIRSMEEGERQEGFRTGVNSREAEET